MVNASQCGPVEKAGNVQPPPGWKSFLQRFLPWATRGGLAVADYGLISGSNFLLGILLARWLSQEQFGAYALAFSIFILAGFLYQALLLEPLSVFSGTLFHDNIRGYLKATVWIHWAICLVMCGLLGASAVVARVFWHSSVLAAGFAGLAIATPFILIHGLGRRGFYLKLSPGPAAFAAVFYFVSVTGGVFLLNHCGRLSTFTAFLTMGSAAFISSIIMLFQLNARLEPETSRPHFRYTWGKHWEYGRWALATSVVGWIPYYFYIPVVSTFSGIAAAAELRAVMNLAAPVLQTFAALSMLFLPYASRLQTEGSSRSINRLTRRLIAIFVAGAVLYWATLIPLRGSIFRLLYAGKYLETAYLIPLFALETIVWSAAVGPAILLRAMESPRSLFIANGAASAVAIVFGIPATRFFGLPGVISSMIAANIVYVAVAFVLYGRRLRSRKPATLEFSQVLEPVSAD